MQQGADAFELDVRLTRDGAPVVIHDATLERTTSLTGPVRARTLAELRMADAGHWYTPDAGRTMPCRDQGVRIPTLAEVLWAFPAMPVLIEVKEPEVQHAVHRVLVDEQACERCVVASEDDAALTAVPRRPGSLRRVGARDRRALPGGAVPAPAPAAALPAPERAGPPPGAPGADARLRGRGAAAGMSGARLDRKRPRHRPAPVGAGGGGGGDERAG